MPQYYYFFFFTGFDRGEKPELEQHLGPRLRELRRPRPPPPGRPPSKQSRHPPPGHTQDKPNGRSVRYQTKEPFFTRDTACFGKVYRTIFQSKTTTCLQNRGNYLHSNDTYKNYKKIFLSIYLHILYLL